MKMANIALERVTEKSLTAEVLPEMEIFSKLLVHQGIMKLSINILHTDCTKCKFNEIGGFQAITRSG